MSGPNEPRKRLLTVLAHPGARKTGVEKIGEGEFKVHVTARPEKGEANREVVAALADHLGLPASRLRIIRGARSRIKRIEVEKSA
jgi:uncharacterized protein YggU (UPF0235/DUF167 family)